MKEAVQHPNKPGFMIIPVSVRRRLKRACLGFIFRPAMRRFLKEPEAYARPDYPGLHDLVRGWGNTGWSGQHEYLAACLAHALTTRGPILECGSGLSTILVGVIARRRGLSHWALEHAPAWETRVRTCLERYGLDGVTLCSTPLRDYGDFDWYDAPLDSMPGEFSLVICDGPPGRTRGGRYGLVPVMKARLAPGCVILLDDVGREQESDTARRWASELDATIDFHGADKPYAQITLRP